MDNNPSSPPQAYIEQGMENQQTVEQKLSELEEENRTLSDLFEESVGRVNTLTMEVEIARLEFEQIFNSVGDATWVINDRYGVVRINRAFLNLLGLKEKEAAITKKCFELFPSRICQTPKCPLEQIRRKKQRIEMDEEREIGQGLKVPFLLTAMPLLGLAGELVGMVEQFKDITDRKRYQEALEKANKELEQLAAIDGLTQVANRRIFDERFQQEWLRMKREKQPFSLILCDIDFFKRYNDHYGHQLGDDCLKAVAACIKDSVHRPSDLVARYGGEEFGILLPNTPFEGAYHMAEKIREAVLKMNREHAASAVGNSVTLSLGVATVIPAEESGSAEKLLKSADKALYASKTAGRNRVTATIN
jgi:diguanylate cyclase (GGDEF)-like protein/PAS domain S-box-containing protein